MRDLDVKFRTGELTSSVHAWREGMSDWKPISQIAEIKQVLDESTKEIDDTFKEDANNKQKAEDL